MASSKRLNDIVSFYSLLDELERRLGGKSRLSTSSSRDLWPQRGVYFFFEDDQKRIDSGPGLRVTRVGTHALTTNSKVRLWKRLSQHKGSTKSGGGNHRGSVFRLLLGDAIISRDGLDYPLWGQGNSAEKETRKQEFSLEKMVSEVIGQMPFLYLPIDDDANPDSLRGYIERNSIALLSNFEKPPIDPPGDEWLGLECSKKKVSQSGLWNRNHVDEDYEPGFIQVFRYLVTNMGTHE